MSAPPFFPSRSPTPWKWNGASPKRQAGVFPLDHGPVQSGRQGLNLRCPASKAGGLDRLSYVLAVEAVGIEPTAGCVRGSLAPLAHAPPSVERSSWESNPDHHRTKVVCGRNTSRPVNDPGEASAG